MRNTRLLLLALAAAPAGGCIDVTYEDPAAFSGTLVSTTPAGVSGQVAAVSQFRNTEAGIDVKADGPGVFGWQIRHGTCASPGEIVGGSGNYPDVTTGASGTGTVERSFISERLDRERQYHAVIVDVQTRQTVLACGTLDRRTF